MSVIVLGKLSTYTSDIPRRSELLMNLEVGYRGATACVAAGITYRQLDYWARTGLVEPTIKNAAGSGSQRLYGFRDILVLKIVKRLLDTGVSLQNIRTAVDHLRVRGITELESMTLMSDGASMWTEVEGSLATLQGENPADGSIVANLTTDELSERRKRKGA